MRRPNIVRPVTLHTTLPENIRAQLDLYLWSEVEGCVPKGAYQQFIIDRIREHLQARSVDLGYYLPEHVPGLIVRGSPLAIEVLSKLLGAHYDTGTASENGRLESESA